MIKKELRAELRQISSTWPSPRAWSMAAGTAGVLAAAASRWPDIEKQASARLGAREEDIRRSDRPTQMAARRVEYGVGICLVDGAHRDAPMQQLEHLVFDP